MQVGVMEIHLHIPWAHSLKEKRMVVKSLQDKIRHRFNVSVAEIQDQDIHQTAVIGIACLSSSAVIMDQVLTHVFSFVEQNTEAIVTDVFREIR